MSTTASVTPTPDQRRQFEEEGWLVLESVGLPEETLDAVIADLDGIYGERRVEGDIIVGPRKLMHGWRISENVKALARAPLIMEFLEQLYGRKPFPFQTLNLCTGSQQPTHADAIHFTSIPQGFMCGVWVALEDIDMDNGPIVYYPGSHKVPEVTMQDLGAQGSFTEYNRYTDYVAETIEKLNLEPKYATIRKGEALIWAANMFHGGARMKDRSRTRHSQVTHYFFEGCRFWTPHSSEPGNIHWMDAPPIE